MKIPIRRIIIALTVSLLCMTLGYANYQLRLKAVEIDSSTSPGEIYMLTLEAVGEPDFPFGYAHGRITLYKNGKRLLREKIDLADDGCQITKDSWSVIWEREYADITLHASEQLDEHWRFSLSPPGIIRQ